MKRFASILLLVLAALSAWLFPEGGPNTPAAVETSPTAQVEAPATQVEAPAARAEAPKPAAPATAAAPKTAAPAPRAAEARGPRTQRPTVAQAPRPKPAPTRKAAPRGPPVDHFDDITIRHYDRVVYRGRIDLRPTIDRILANERFPHRNDGAVFKNRERRLPRQPRGYYREYVHPTKGRRGPGAQRVVVGRGGDWYYTPDHYQTFRPMQ